MAWWLVQSNKGMCDGNQSMTHQLGCLSYTNRRRRFFVPNVPRRAINIRTGLRNAGLRTLAPLNRAARIRCAMGHSAHVIASRRVHGPTTSTRTKGGTLFESYWAVSQSASIAMELSGEIDHVEECRDTANGRDAPPTQKQLYASFLCRFSSFKLSLIQLPSVMLYIVCVCDRWRAIKRFSTHSSRLKIFPDADFGMTSMNLTPPLSLL